MLSNIRRFAPLGVTLAFLPSCYLFCPYNADQFFETTVRAECHFYFACCTAGEQLNAAVLARPEFADMQRFRDEGNCIQERLEEGSQINFGARAVAQAEAAGRFKYDYAIAQLCGQPRIDALNSCNADFVLGDAAPLDVPEECERAPGVGLVPDGGDCFFEFECAVPGSSCEPASVLDEVDPDDEPEEPDEIIITQPKICIQPFKEGDSCEFDPDVPFQPLDCEVGTSCFTDPDDGDAECTALGEEGDDCNGLDEDVDCADGLFCNAEGECEEVAQEGDDCSEGQVCDIGLTCDITQPDVDDIVCIAPLPVEVEICNGVNGTPDPTYPSKE